MSGTISKKLPNVGSGPNNYKSGASSFYFRQLQSNLLDFFIWVNQIHLDYLSSSL